MGHGHPPGLQVRLRAALALTPRPLRLDEELHEKLRARAAAEGTSMQEVVQLAVVEYIHRHSRQDAVDRILDEELPRYAEALRRLGE